jgi:hypothetical protein
MMHMSRRRKLVVSGAVAFACAVIAATAGVAQAASRLDTTPPGSPTFISTDYPSAGPTTVTLGGSGVIALSATDDVSVASFRYTIDGSGLNAGGLSGTLNANKQGKANLMVPLIDLHVGTNTVFAQTVDGAGNTSPPASYTFFVQQAAFGPVQPGVAGDLTGDGVPDLVTITATGDVQIFPNPATTSVDPVKGAAGDPHQFGGQMLLPATSNPRWPMPDNASASGALLTHGGSFTGNNFDDIIEVQNGFMSVASTDGGLANWRFLTTDATKPGCGTCADYNGQDWSSVTQMVAVPTAPDGRPNLLTVEVVNGHATLWWYPAFTGAFTFQTPTALSIDSASWRWGNVQLIGAGVLPGTTGVTLWVRNSTTGKVFLLHNVVAGLPNPAASAVRVANGFTAAAFPLLTTPGTPDSSGNLPLWTTNANGRLAIVPTTTNSSGVTTVGKPIPISKAGWASHEIALGGTYPPYNNSGIAATGSPNAAFDTATDNAFAYNADALANATVDPDAIVNDGSGGCPTGWTTCAPGLGPSTLVSLPNSLGAFSTFTLPASWQQQPDNDIAAGQLLAVPVPSTSGPAHTIRFLGAAVTTDANGASVPVTVTFTNGDTQTITITLANWTQDLSAAPVAGDITVATMDHRTVAATGADDPTVNYLFATPEITLLDNGAPLGTNVQIASVTLGSNASVHFVSMAIG